MSGNRVFIGRLPRGSREQDIEKFFSRCGRIRGIMLKRGYAFVDFRTDRDASDAVHDMNGRSMRGERMTVEIASGRQRKGSRDQKHRSSSARNDASSNGEYQIVVENLSSRISWKDFKDMIRREDIEVVHVDAHKLHKHQGIVKFRTHSDLKRAIKKFQNREIEGRRLEITETRSGSRERSGSRDSLDRNPPSKKRYRSRSASSVSLSPRPKRKAGTPTSDSGSAEKEALNPKDNPPYRREGVVSQASRSNSRRISTPDGKSSPGTSSSRSSTPARSKNASSSSSGSESPPKTPDSP
ncbi:serine/arginine-rich splicing factor 5 [Galendromus occidentalis]|uniref:Serine/arginine-rich splicing factor 5 n=1 Tax=Galendromus occidentalis TaxID=34638 RepID=A0AAJ6VYW0_9ACAR|nr:serine/arginine-rich splicing factor 5 [Galendromus occidentalis]